MLVIHRSYSISKKANMELNALTKVQKYMTPEQKTLTSSFTEFQSNCCSLIWIFCSKKALRRLNNKHESSLHLIHQEYVSNIRSSRPDVFCDFFKKETLAQVFSCEFCEISKNIFFYRTPLVAASETLLQFYSMSQNILNFSRERFINTLMVYHVK